LYSLHFQPTKSRKRKHGRITGDPFVVGEEEACADAKREQDQARQRENKRMRKEALQERLKITRNSILRRAVEDPPAILVITEKVDKNVSFIKHHPGIHIQVKPSGTVTFKTNYHRIPEG
jgi:hypothetical protein